MPELRIAIIGVDNIKTQTVIRKIMDKNEEIDRVLITKVTFEGELDPADVAQIHRLLKSGAGINISIWSLPTQYGTRPKRLNSKPVET